MNDQEKLGMTPEEFLEAFQLYLCQFGSKDLLLSSSTPNSSHLKDFVEILIKRRRDLVLDNLLK